MTSEQKKLLLFCVFISSLTSSLLLSSKIAILWGISFSAGTLAYAVLFAITDSVSESFGKADAKSLVYMGWVAYGIVVIFSLTAVLLPPAPFWASNQPAYEAIIGFTPRIILASFISYSVSQYFDVWAFHFCKTLTKGRYLWLRNNLSTLASQFIDTVIFVVIAFWGVIPNDQLLALIGGQYILKLVIAIIDTPVVYWICFWVRRSPEPIEA